jgi:hypothetical protein
MMRGEHDRDCGDSIAYMIRVACYSKSASSYCMTTLLRIGFAGFTYIPKRATAMHLTDSQYASASG